MDYDPPKVGETIAIPWDFGGFDIVHVLSVEGEDEEGEITYLLLASTGGAASDTKHADIGRTFTTGTPYTFIVLTAYPTEE